MCDQAARARDNLEGRGERERPVHNDVSRDALHPPDYTGQRSIALEKCCRSSMGQTCSYISSLRENFPPTTGTGKAFSHEHTVSDSHSPHTCEILFHNIITFLVDGYFRQKLFRE